MYSFYFAIREVWNGNNSNCIDNSLFQKLLSPFHGRLTFLLFFSQICTWFQAALWLIKILINATYLKRKKMKPIHKNILHDYSRISICSDDFQECELLFQMFIDDNCKHAISIETLNGYTVLLKVNRKKSAHTFVFKPQNCAN